MSKDAFDPSRTYVAACADGTGREIPIDARFWPDLMNGKYPELANGWLVGAFPMREDWTSWEMHPAGEEILTLLSGELEILVEERGERRSIMLRAGQTFLMPRGAWHRALVRQPGVMLGITYGRGTEHRPA